ncbi:MAG: helix-turn-helix transcriptional regulator [Planctomycetes bacterium]|nr:helix-turn-helix transcriptional regulator [Planctomycetota bacterium]
MDQQLISVLSNTILPMAEELTLDRLILPGAAGKKPFGNYPPSPDLSAAERGEDLQAKNPIAYMAHPRSVEWVFGFSGKAELAMDGKRYELSKGCMGLIPPKASHLERIYHRDQGYHLIWILAYLERNRVTIHSSSYSGGNLFQLVSGASIEKCTNVCNLFAQSAEEFQRREFGWENMLRSTAVEVLIRIVRHIKEHGLGQEARTYQASVIDFAKSYINGHYAEPLTLEDVAHQVFLSPNYFTSLFTAKAGLTVFDYIRDVRLTEAGRLMSQSDLNVREIAKEVGFGNRSHFARSFKKHFGCTPREYKRRAVAKV